MNTIKQLIEKYCPDGVEYKKLGEVADIKTGKGITKKDALEGGSYPIISGGICPMGCFKFKNRKANTVTISRVGANAGYVNFIEEDFYLNDKCFSIIPFGHWEKSIDHKYLYYFLKNVETKIVLLQSEGGVPTINTNKVGGILIPVPPLPVQREIVRILDNFTSLEAELEAELEARRKQYEYYRDQLLSFKHLTGGGKNNVLWKTLGEVCKVLRGKRLTKKELSDDGPFPVFHGGIEPIGYFSEGNREAESVMIIDVGASAGTVGYSKKVFWSSDGCFCLSHVSILDQRYLFFLLQSLEKNLKSKVRRAGIPTLDSKVLENLSIPVPPISVQHRIVSILDRFESLVNDISSGLPAEIAARHQQYEYYRDQLLSFKRKS